MLLHTVENITIAKTTYNTLYKTLEKKLHLTIPKLSTEKLKEIKDEFTRENYWAKHVSGELDCWISFYYSKGRFPGSQNLILLPQIDIPDFIKTDMPLSSIDLYQKFKATNSKVLVLLQAIAALNLHLGGDKKISKKALVKFLSNLTFQALSKENDNIFLDFANVGNLTLNILENLIKIDKKSVNDSKILSENLKEELNKTDYKFDLPPALKIQENVKKYRKERKITPPPRGLSTPLKPKEISKTYDEEKENYLQNSITTNKTDLDAAIENVEESNKSVIYDIVDPTPGLIVDDKINLDKHFKFKFKSKDLEREFDLSDQIQDRLNNILELMKENTQPFPNELMVEKLIEVIPNDPLSSEKSDIKLKTFLLMIIILVISSFFATI